MAADSAGVATWAGVLPANACRTRRWLTMLGSLRVARRRLEVVRCGYIVHVAPMQLCGQAEALLLLLLVLLLYATSIYDLVQLLVRRRWRRPMGRQCRAAVVPMGHEGTVVLRWRLLRRQRHAARHACHCQRRGLRWDAKRLCGGWLLGRVLLPSVPSCTRFSLLRQVHAAAQARLESKYGYSDIFWRPWCAGVSQGKRRGVAEEPHAQD